MDTIKGLDVQCNSVQWGSYWFRRRVQHATHLPGLTYLPIHNITVQWIEQPRAIRRHHICQQIYTSNLLTNIFFTRKRVNCNTWHFATKQRNSDYKAIFIYWKSNYTNTLISFVLFVHSFIHLSHIFTRLSRFNHIFV